MSGRTTLKVGLAMCPPRSQKTEVRRQKTEVRRMEIFLLTPDFWLLRFAESDGLHRSPEIGLASVLPSRLLEFRNHAERRRGRKLALARAPQLFVRVRGDEQPRQRL